MIRESRPATQMPSFGDKLQAEEIQALTDWIYTKVVPAPVWGEAEIKASQVVDTAALDLPNKPSKALKGADPMNLFIVVETGDHHVSVLDGDKLERLHASPAAMRCMAARSIRRMDALFTSPRAMAGSPSTTCGT